MAQLTLLILYHCQFNVWLLDHRQAVGLSSSANFLGFPFGHCIKGFFSPGESNLENNYNCNNSIYFSYSFLLLVESIFGYDIGKLC